MEDRVSGAFIFVVPVIVIVLSLMFIVPIVIIDYVSYKGWLNECVVER